MTMDSFRGFPFAAAGEFATAMIRRVYEAEQLAPTANPAVAAIPEEGEGMEGLVDAFRGFVSGSAGLAAAGMAGHMDTAPHPAAAFADALVSAANNNLLFRELSPLASRIEEVTLADLGARLGLSADWAATFASGGSLANLTALFAATGGFGGAADRAQCALFAPECAHVSIRKSAAVLGICAERYHVVAGDAQGRADVSGLRDALRASNARRKVVVGVLGSTVHGAVEDIRALAEASSAHGAWLHVDAAYGGGLAFSHRHRGALRGLDAADSIVIAPQKWMFVPRVSAIVWVKGRDRFDRALGTEMPYSAAAESHRGRWGLQGSRRADAVTLWVVLRYVGARSLGCEVDRQIDLTRSFWKQLSADDLLEPTHPPDLNLLCFRYRDRNLSERRTHEQLGRGDFPWVSLSAWRQEPLFRSVLLSPGTDEAVLGELIKALHRMAS